MQFDQVLSNGERQRHARFCFAKDRRRYVLTRSLARYVLSRYVPMPPVAWRFEVTAFGRPLLADPARAAQGLSFNISHSDRVVMMGVTRGAEVGIDVEDLGREVPLELAGGFSHPARCDSCKPYRRPCGHGASWRPGHSRKATSRPEARD